MRKLAEFAKSQPHAAFSAYIHGLQHKYRYFMRTIHNISECLEPLDDIITNTFIPAVIGLNVSDAERELISLPVRCGGLGTEVLN